MQTDRNLLCPQDPDAEVINTQSDRADIDKPMSLVLCIMWHWTCNGCKAASSRVWSPVRRRIFQRPPPVGFKRSEKRNGWPACGACTPNDAVGALVQNASQRLTVDTVRHVSSKVQSTNDKSCRRDKLNVDFEMAVYSS